MFNLRRFIKKPSRRMLIVTSGVVVCVLIGLYLLAGRLPTSVWLPPSTAYQSDDDILYDLPTKVNAVTTIYGRALIYQTTNQTALYEFTTNPLLKASACPNVAGREALDPSACTQQGTFEGKPIYNIDRNDEESASEQFVNIGHTFIVIIGNSGTNYVQQFVQMPSSQTTTYLASTSQRAGAVTSRLQKQKSAADYNDTLAYTRLPFTPALPQSLPSGWHLLTNITTPPIAIDGPDADNPTMVNMDYTNAKKQFVSIHVGKLSAFQLGGTCGPSPGYSMQNLPCTKVPNTNYYEADLYDTSNDLLRYLYYPLGDSLVISDVTIYDNGNAKPTMPADLAAAQTAITLSMHPVSITALKGSIYYKTYY